MDEPSRRFDFDSVPPGGAWQGALADAVLARSPHEDVYTCAAGISPSGPVHFGNFRDVITSYLVGEELKKKGKKVRLLFSWDNFDRLRKVPSGVPESFAEHIGKPLSKIPDPKGELASYAERYERPFVEAMRTLDIPLDYRNQTDMYQSGEYDSAIFFALSKRKEIADVLLSFMTEKAKGEKSIEAEAYRDAYYPISLYSRFTGKDSTKILEYDGQTTVTYYCSESRQTEAVDLSKDRIAKLAWKVDWPMRWKHEKVSFEPGGHDHASPGGSYDVASKMARIFSFDPPVFAEYKFVGLQGGGAKMSGSRGNAVTPAELLQIYEPELLKWMYLRRRPDQSFQLSFDTEIYRQYDEYDAEVKTNAIPFRQAVGFGQIVQWDESKMAIILKEMQLSYDSQSIGRRLFLARNWLNAYNPSEKITLCTVPNAIYASGMDDKRKAAVRRLKEALPAAREEGIQALETLVYDIPKESGLEETGLKKAQRAFFKDVYNLLIGSDTGPRLGTFLWALDLKTVISLLSVA